MLLTIATFIAGLFGVKDILKIQRWMSMSLVIGVILVVLVASALVFRSCGKREVKLNQQEIQDLQHAQETRDAEKLRKVLIDSDVRAKEINENVAGATAEKVNAIHESKERWKNATEEEMMKELENRK